MEPASPARLYATAVGALLVPLKNAMQRRPVPDIVWRTAKLKHDLGPVAVQRGEKIAIGIVSATQHSLEEGKADVMPVFGGARVKDGPTHACPGYAAGMGVLLGMVSGLLEAGLSFIGVGDPNVMSLGTMLNAAQQYLRYAWWTAIFPGAAICLVTLGIALISDGLNDALNPRLKETGR